MALEIKGHFIQSLALVTGQSSKGDWVKREFIIETLDEKYPKKVCLAAWGETTNVLSTLQTGDVLTVSFAPESREYNNRWYTELRAWKIAPEGQAAPQPQRTATLPPQPVPTFDEESNDLPF